MRRAELRRADMFQHIDYYGGFGAPDNDRLTKEGSWLTTQSWFEGLRYYPKGEDADDDEWLSEVMYDSEEEGMYDDDYDYDDDDEEEEEDATVQALGGIERAAASAAAGRAFWGREALSRPVCSLSSGQQMRLLIAVAIARQPSLLQRSATRPECVYV